MSCDDCVPDRPLPADDIPMRTTCTKCAAVLVRHWTAAGTDFSWFDTDGSWWGGKSGIDGVDTMSDWLDWLLRKSDATGDVRYMNAYSVGVARFRLGMFVLPWQHLHQPAPERYADALLTVPWCCGQPMQSVRDGWRCRTNKTIFTVPERQAKTEGDR